MSNPTTICRIEPVLQSVAKGMYLAAIAIGVLVLGLKFLQNVKLQVRLETAIEEEKRLTADVTAMDARVQRKNARVQDVAAEVSKELEQKHQLHLAMADVLARVRVLQEQRDRFEEVRSEIKARLGKMDDYYYGARQQAPGIVPH